MNAKDSSLSGFAETELTSSFIEKQRAGVVFWRVIAALAVIISAIFAYCAAKQLLEPELLLILLGAYAGIGVFFLLCTALGSCRFSADEQNRLPALVTLEMLEQAVVLTNEHGAVDYMNAAYRRLSENRRQSPDVLFGHDEAAARIIYRLTRSAKQGNEDQGEIHLAGNFVYHVTVRPFRLDGQIMRMWALNKQSDKQGVLVGDLQDAVSHLDSAPAGFAAWDGQERIGYLNATLAGWLGFDLAAFTPGDMVLSTLVGTENTARIHDMLKNSAAMAVVKLDLDFRQGGQPSRRLRFYITQAAEGGFFRAIVLPVDVRQGHSVLDEIIQGGQDILQFNNYFDISPVALAVIDETCAIKRANMRFRQLFNLHMAEEPQGLQDFLAMLEPGSGERTGLAIRQALECDTGQATVVEAVLNGEEERYVRLYINSVRQGEDGAAAVVLSVIETTEQRALEQHMEHSQKMQAVGQLAGGIAHDFNNVLTAIIMSCDFLLGNHRNSDPSHQDIMNIKNNANRAASLVQQLLAFSRRQTLRPEVLDLTERLVDLRPLVTKLVGHTNRLELEHGRALWPVKADGAELGRVIMNLAANARDAMSAGGVLKIRTANISEPESRKLDYQKFTPGDYVLIEVSDNGSGIAPAILAKIFDPFFTTKEVGKGTGLGLSTVYGIITQTGGYIHCDSAPGRGTCFSIYLPRYVESERDRQESRLAQERREVEKQGASKSLDLSGSATVLLVEDEDAVRMGGVKALQSRGYTVLEAASGVEALDVIADNDGHIDIVVSDVVMPEMDGPTLFMAIKKRYPEMKFVFVSGYARDAFAGKLPEDAQFAFLAKPFSLKQLATTVKEMLAEPDIISSSLHENSHATL